MYNHMSLGPSMLALDMFLHFLCVYSFMLNVIVYLSFFFFSSRRRHTMLTCDWSSDVCSSDLRAADEAGFDFIAVMDHFFQIGAIGPPEREIGRASCRERVSIAGEAVYLQK